MCLLLSLRRQGAPSALAHAACAPPPAHQPPTVRLQRFDMSIVGKGRGMRARRPCGRSAGQPRHLLPTCWAAAGGASSGPAARDKRFTAGAKVPSSAVPGAPQPARDSPKLLCTTVVLAAVAAAATCMPSAVRHTTAPPAQSSHPTSPPGLPGPGRAPQPCSSAHTASLPQPH